MAIMLYTPEHWCILRLTDNKGNVHHRVGASWSGGYLSGKSWKINSGIVEYNIDVDAISFKGDSGSIYVCYIQSEGVDWYLERLSVATKKKHQKDIPLRLLRLNSLSPSLRSNYASIQ
jgi:hypothetical protein